MASVGSWKSRVDDGDGDDRIIRRDKLCFCDCDIGRAAITNSRKKHCFQNKVSWRRIASFVNGTYGRRDESINNRRPRAGRSKAVDRKPALYATDTVRSGTVKRILKATERIGLHGLGALRERGRNNLCRQSFGFLMQPAVLAVAKAPELSLPLPGIEANVLVKGAHAPEAVAAP